MPPFYFFIFFFAVLFLTSRPSKPSERASERELTARLCNPKLMPFYTLRLTVECLRLLLLFGTGLEGFLLRNSKATETGFSISLSRSSSSSRSSSCASSVPLKRDAAALSWSKARKLVSSHFDPRGKLVCVLNLVSGSQRCSAVKAERQQAQREQQLFETVKAGQSECIASCKGMRREELDRQIAVSFPKN